MSRHKAKRIVIALRLSTQAGRQCLSGILNELTDRHANWDLRIKRDASEFRPTDVRALRDWHIDGIVYGLPTYERAAEETVSEIMRLNIPTVVCNEDVRTNVKPNASSWAHVAVDPRPIGETAALFYLRQGRFRSYGFVTDYRQHIQAMRLGVAFNKTLSEFGFNCLAYPHPAQNQDDFNVLCEWLTAMPKPAAVFVASDSRALTLFEAARAVRLNIPDDLAVLGLGNDEYVCNWARPTLSSVLPDYEGIGRLAVRMLSARMEGRAQHQAIRPLTPVVIERGSTLKTTHAGLLVQEALAYIQAHAGEKINSDVVAAAMKVSRRLLDLRFRELQNRSVSAEIRDRRLALLKRRLHESTDTIDNIILSCGFDNAVYPKQLFKARFGLTMGEWRKQA